MNFQGEVKVYFPPSCICKYLFICMCECVRVWKYNECIEIYTWLLFFFFYMLIWEIFHVETSLRFNLPLRRVDKQSTDSIAAQVLPVELKEPSHLPMFVYMTQPVATVTELLWRQFAVCLQFLFSAFFPPFFFSSCVCWTRDRDGWIDVLRNPDCFNVQCGWLSSLLPGLTAGLLYVF